MVDSPKKRQKIEYSQAFNELWLEDDQLKDWISKSDDPQLIRHCVSTVKLHLTSLKKTIYCATEPQKHMKELLLHVKVSKI